MLRLNKMSAIRLCSSSILIFLALAAGSPLHSCGGSHKKAGMPFDSSVFGILNTGTSNFTLNDAVVYPNPFQPAKGHTDILISDIPFGTRIEIFTVTGQRVRELSILNNCLEVAWDGKDAQGQDVETGIYVAFLKLGTESKTVKIAIVR